MSAPVIKDLEGILEGMPQDLKRSFQRLKRPNPNHR